MEKIIKRISVAVMTLVCVITVDEAGLRKLNFYEND